MKRRGRLEHTRRARTVGSVGAAEGPRASAVGSVVAIGTTKASMTVAVLDHRPDGIAGIRVALEREVPACLRTGERAGVVPWRTPRASGLAMRMARLFAAGTASAPGGHEAGALAGTEGPMRFLFPSLRHDRTFLTPCAQHSRRYPTPSERILWEALRARRLGFKFRRQVVLGTVIVDFFAPEVRLAVEVDGAAHVGREVRDRERDAYLSRFGVRVLRVKAWHVERELHAVLARIRAALG